MTKPLFPLAPTVGMGPRPHGLSTASARASAARRATRWSPTLRRPHFRGAASACANRWTRSAPSRDRCSRSRDGARGTTFRSGLLDRGHSSDRRRSRCSWSFGRGAATDAGAMGRRRVPLVAPMSDAQRSLLGARRGRRRPHPRAIQRGVPVPARLRPGSAIAFVPLVLVVMYALYAVVAYPAGSWSDRGDRRSCCRRRSVLLALADIVLAARDSIPWLDGRRRPLGTAHGLDPGPARRAGRRHRAADQRGTAFGVFNLVTGLALLAASVIAGLVWDGHGPAATFLTGASLAAAAAAAALVLHATGRLSPSRGAA